MSDDAEVLVVIVAGTAIVVTETVGALGVNAPARMVIALATAFIVGLSVMYRGVRK